MKTVDSELNKQLLAYGPTGPWRVHQTTGNARLIAAAPDLLAALISVRDYFSEIDTMRPGKLLGAVGESVRAQVGAAISKATG